VSRSSSFVLRGTLVGSVLSWMASSDTSDPTKSFYHLWVT
jgi:hypothetical protein